jgi:hypothetical protein
MEESRAQKYIYINQIQPLLLSSYSSVHIEFLQGEDSDGLGHGPRGLTMELDFLFVDQIMGQKNSSSRNPRCHVGSAHKALVCHRMHGYQSAEKTRMERHNGQKDRECESVAKGNRLSEEHGSISGVISDESLMRMHSEENS